MSNEEANQVLEELHEVRPEKLNDKAKRLFEAIMKIVNSRDKAEADLYEANNRINDLLETVEQKDEIINEMAIRIFDLQEWIKKQVDYECFTLYKTVEDIKKVFEERCK